MSTLEEIKARAEKATPGPWKLAHPRPDGRNLVERRGYDLYGGEVSEMIIVDTNPSDAEFIAHARTDIPKLIAALEAVLNLANHEPRFRSRMHGGEYFPLRVSADEIIEAITEALA